MSFENLYCKKIDRLLSFMNKIDMSILGPLLRMLNVTNLTGFTVCYVTLELLTNPLNFVRDISYWRAKCLWYIQMGFFINEQMKYVFSNYLLVTLATRYTFELIFSFMDWSNMLIKVNMYRFCGFEFGHKVTHNL